MANELLDYKLKKQEDWKISQLGDGMFLTTAFTKDYTEVLTENGFFDDPVIFDEAHIESSKGIRLDGFSFNESDGILSCIVTDFEDEDKIVNISKTDTEKAGNRVTKFLEQIEKSNYDHLEKASEGYEAAENINFFFQKDEGNEDIKILKIRIAVLTSKVLSDRAKKDFSKKDQKFTLKRKIKNKDCFLEVYDLQRFKDIEDSDTVSEPVNVNFLERKQTIKALPANVENNESGIESYLCVMPGKLLSELYDEFGQRLLESNVRTFLDFTGKVNKGIRETLLLEPEYFFAFNNGLTVTGKNIKTKSGSNGLEITHIDDMQIVNGGQTAASIFFAPKDKSRIASGQRWQDIDLSKVFLQMKLTIISEEIVTDKMQADIARFANSQNAVNTADLNSNHPFHKNLEEISLRLPMPTGQGVTSTFWFYERARGAYKTKRRKELTPSKQKQFEIKFPRSQLFTKTDLAKYENTWRMNPHEVKQGAQKNFVIMGDILSREYDKNPDDFEEPFFKDIVAKAILFKQTDSEINRAEWYKDDRGLKAETTTFTLAFLRHIFKKEKKDINLETIYKNQSISEDFLNEILKLANFVRNKMRDDNFRNGIANISEFTKSKNSWEAFKNLDYQFDFSKLNRNDWLNANQQQQMQKEQKETKKVSAQISDFQQVMNISESEWRALAEFNTEKGYELTDKQVSLPNLMAVFVSQQRKVPSEKQFQASLDIRIEAKNNGFEYFEN